MAIETDFSVAVNGDIRHVANTNHYTVLELHRFLQSRVDDESPASGDDYLDITTTTPSERVFDTIINLLGDYNIDDDAAEYFYGGSIKQGSGVTEILYSGLKVLGSVDDPNTQIQVIQDHGYYDTTTPFWGDQSGGGYNGDTVAGVLFRCLIKSRVNGCDIDTKRIRVQIRAWGDTYDFFNTTLDVGESVASVSSTPDAQSIAIGTVQGWVSGDIPTNGEGYQQIDINNGNGNFPYYSKWTYNTNALLMKAIWNHIKEITGNDSPEVATPHGMNGELFLGVTHAVVYQNESGGPFVEDEALVWGTEVTYGTLAGGTFTEGKYIAFTRSTVLINSGRIGYDNGSVQMTIALEDLAAAPLDGDVMTEYDPSTGATGVTAAVDTTIVDADLDGGEGVLLALDDQGAIGNLYIQITNGVAPSTTQQIRSLNGGSGASADVNGAPAAKTVPKVFLGSYTGSLIGAYGIGIDADDLTSTDTVEPLVGAVQTPPNNVTFSLDGLEVGEDRVLIGNKDTGDDFEWTEMTLAAALTGPTETIVDVGTGNIPADAPATGILRISLDDGRIRRVAYTSHDGDDEFTIGSSDWQDPDDAAIGKGVMLAFIDKLAAASPEEFTLQYDATRTLWIRVRDGGATPIKTYESQGTLGLTGGSAVATRTPDA